MEITVNGKQYEFVTLDSLTLDELIVVWDYTKMGLDEIVVLESFHPGVTAALIHVSVARGEPGTASKEIRRVVGSLRVTQLEEVFSSASVEGAEALPPENAPAADSKASGQTERSGGPSEPTGAMSQADDAANGSGDRGSDIGADYAHAI